MADLSSSTGASEVTEWAKRSFSQYRGRILSEEEDSEDEPTTSPAPKPEDIRRKLASAAAATEGGLQDNSLLVCFMNEVEESSDNSDDCPGPRFTALARANISNKKEHVIIPIQSVLGDDNDDDWADAATNTSSSIVQENPLFTSTAYIDSSEEDFTGLVLDDHPSILCYPHLIWRVFSAAIVLHL